MAPRQHELPHQAYIFMSLLALIGGGGDKWLWLVQAANPLFM